MSNTEIVSAIVAIGAVATMIYNLRNNAGGVKNDIIKTYETRLNQMRTDLDQMQKDMAEVKTLLETSERERKAALDTLNLRNPEFERYMELSLKLLTDIHGAVMTQTVSPKA